MRKLFELQPGQKWAYHLTTFLEAPSTFFFVRSVLEIVVTSCGETCDYYFFKNRFTKEWVTHLHACLYAILQYSSKIHGEVNGWGNSKQYTREKS